jgi:protein SCO1/2
MNKSKNSGLQQRYVISVLLMLVASAAFVAFVYVFVGNNAAQQAVPTADYNYTGKTPIDPPQDMPDFTLTNQDGEATSLSDLQGKPTLIFFGFTNCPDVCPTTISDFRIIQRNLGEDGDQVNFVFISVDGNRDTPDVLKEYFSTRGVESGFVGLTGDPEAVREIGEAYGVVFEYGEPNENGAYDVSHTPSVFLLNAAGEWVAEFALGTESAVITDELRALLG